MPREMEQKNSVSLIQCTCTAAADNKPQSGECQSSSDTLPLPFSSPGSHCDTPQCSCTCAPAQLANSSALHPAPPHLPAKEPFCESKSIEHLQKKRGKKLSFFYSPNQRNYAVIKGTGLLIVLSKHR